MHIHSERIYNEIRNEIGSIWYIPANEGAELALLIKAPSSCIKALVAGCKLELTFGKFEHYLCVGVRIYDVPDAPILISKLQRNAEEHASLMRALKECKIPIFLFGEMDVCLAETTAVISEVEASAAVDLLGSESNLYVGTNPDIASHVLDCFCHSYDNQSHYPNAHEIPIATVVAQYNKWNTMNNHFYGISGFQNIDISDKNEGEMLERTVWATLSSVFPLTLYHAPKDISKGKERELTDVFSFYPFGSFLIETKDLSVFKAGYDRDQERRIAGVQKQVKKAIGQLVGASKAFSRGDAIFDSCGKALNIDRSNPPHCIVLITELMHAGDWEEIVKQMCDAMAETNAFFHLIDLREFIELLKGSSGDPHLLDYNLMKRCELFWKVKSVFIRSEPPVNADNETSENS